MTALARLTLRHVATGIEIVGMEVTDPNDTGGFRSRQVTPVKDLLGRAFNVIAKTDGRNPVQIMADPHTNRFLAVLEIWEDRRIKDPPFGGC